MSRNTHTHTHDDVSSDETKYTTLKKWLLVYSTQDFLRIFVFLELIQMAGCALLKRILLYILLKQYFPVYAKVRVRDFINAYSSISTGIKQYTNWLPNKRLCLLEFKLLLDLIPHN